MLRERKPFEDHEDLPEWLAKKCRESKGAKWEVWVNSLLKVREQLYGHPYKDALEAVHDQLGIDLTTIGWPLSTTPRTPRARCRSFA